MLGWLEDDIMVVDGLSVGRVVVWMILMDYNVKWLEVKEGGNKLKSNCYTSTVVEEERRRIVSCIGMAL